MDISDLKRHYLRRNAKEMADVIGKSITAVYMKADGELPFTLEEIVQVLRHTKDPTLLEELASRIGFFVLARPTRRLNEERVAKRVSALSRRLSKGTPVKPRDVFELGLALVAYSEALRNGGIQKELDL